MAGQKEWSSPALFKTKLPPNAEQPPTKWIGNFQKRYPTPRNKEETTSRW